MSKVQLYVYDLSQGMAKALSLSLTGKQIDGIWHTSVVVFGREIFYGRGIMEAPPGTTHHGTPVQKIDCGETHIDSETFQEYLASLADMYTASAYHLMDFNCNHFTSDVIGFLTGAETPSWITGLPAEFLSTPFGQAMKPSIDAMFRASSANEHSAFDRGSTVHSPPAPPAPPAIAANNQPSQRDLASMLLSTVAQHAAGNGSANGPQKSTAISAPLLAVTSAANFDSILKNNPVVIANFTNSPGCPPCRVIKPAYEAFAETYTESHGDKGVRFVEIELGVGEGQRIASTYGVSATPTFIFFKDGKKADEMKGADKRSLEARIESFLDLCFPQHPHRRVYLAETGRISTNPITATATPAYPALLNKLETFPGAGKDQVAVLRNDVVPFLDGKATLDDNAVRGLIVKWTTATKTLLTSLKPAETFPVIDLWRIGLLNPRVVSALVLKLSPKAAGAEPIGPILSLVAKTIQTEGASTPRPLVLTALRLCTNLLAPLPLANLVLSHGAPLQADLLTVLVDSLLHKEVSVRKAAADVAVNAAAWRHRVAKEANSVPDADNAVEAEWEVEVLSALIEGIGREDDAEVGHRLLVASALIIYLSPGFETSIQPLLEVLGAKQTIEAAGKRWGKPDVRKLAIEVASKMC